MTTSKVQITEGSGKNAATYSVSEDDVTKELQRIVPNNSSGTEIGTESNPIRVDTTGTTSSKTVIYNSSGTELANSSNPLIVDFKAGGQSIEVQGNFAHDAGSDTGKPVRIGAYAVNAQPAAVANADRVNLTADLTGKLITLPYCNPENLVSGATSDITNTTATTIIAGVASNYLYITQLIVTNSHATVGTFVNITEETSGTVLYTGYAAALGGGFAVTFPTPLKVPTAARALQATCVTTGSNVRVSAVGYKSTI